jgi:glycine betaine/proline transport system substrate-binding protein
MKKKLVLTLTIIISALALFAAGCSGGGADNTIAIGKVPYTHEWIPAYIVQSVAEELGYDTKIVEGDVGFMFLGLAQGDIDIYPDAWLPILHKTYADKYEDKIELTGTVFENAAMGWAVPSYVDIDTIDELKGKGDQFNHRIVGIEPSAGLMLTSEKALKEYDLDDEYELLESSTPAMLGEVEQAIANKQPIVFLAWRPHAMFTKYDIKLLEDPKEIWPFDNVITAVNKELKDKAPDLYEFTHNFSISLDDIEAILAEADKGDKDIEQLTQEWMEQNRDQINEMLNKSR